MSVRVVEPPQPFISRERVKKHLNIEVEDTEFDDLIDGYVASAVAWLDGPEGWLGRCLGEQVLELVGEGFPTCRLPYGPVIEAVSVTYVGAAGVDVVIPPADYRLLADGWLYADAWPSVSGGPDAVRVRWRAGYPDRSVPPAEEGGEAIMVPTVPTPIVQAVLLLVGQWFKTRENVVTGTIATAVPFSVESLLAPYRVWR